MNDPMTEGAERGTLLTMQESPHLLEVYFGEKFLFGFYYKERKTVESLVHSVNDHVGPVLTEALKVAGELAVDYARHQSLCNGALGGRCTCGLDDRRAALERIKGREI